MTGRGAAFKVARKNAVRNRKRTIFLVLLVAVPVAFGVVVAGIVKASTLTPEEQAQTQFGSAEARIDLHAPDTEMGNWVRSTLAETASGLLVTEFHQYGIRVPGLGYAQVWDINLRDPAAEGLLLLLDGTTPVDGGEVAISPGLAEELEVGLGEKVQFENLPLGEMEVVGFVSEPFFNTGNDVLLAPGGLEPLRSESVNPASTALLVSGADAGNAALVLQDAWYNVGQEQFWPEPAVDPLPDEIAFLAEDPVFHRLLTEEEVEELVVAAQELDESVEFPQDEIWNAAAQMVYGSSEFRGLPDLYVQTRQQWLSWNSFENQPAIVSTGVAALLLVEVAFITGAAFAAGTRRRLREIGLMGANGASQSHVKTTVLGEGLAIGAVGALAGVVLGIAVLFLARPLLQRFVSRLIVGLGVSLLDVLGPVLVAIISVLLAVAIPARTASKVPTTTALQGRMPALSPRKWVVPLGMGSAAAGLLLILVSLASNSNYAGFLVGVGAVMVVGGVAMLASPILAGVTRLSDHVPATSRLVLRDSGRNRTRSAVAVAAIMVILLAPVTAMTVAASSAEKSLVFGLPDPGDHLILSGSYANVNFGNPVPITETDVAALAAAIPDQEVALFDTFDIAVVTNEILEARESGDGNGPVVQQLFDGNSVAAGSNELVALLDHPGAAVSIDKGEIVVLGVEDKETRVELDGTEYSAHEYPVPVMQWQMPRVLLPEAMISRFPDSDSKPMALFVLERSLTDDEWQSVYDLGLEVNGGYGGLSETATYLSVGAATLLVVLIVVALVTAVSAAEVDQEIRTIVAVGAPGSIRRRFLSLLTGYQTLIAMGLAVPLGLGLVWAFSSANEYIQVGPFGLVSSSAVTVPWIWIIPFAVLLPIIIGLLTMISVRSAPVTPPRRAT